MNFKNIDINLKLQEKLRESGFTDLTMIQEQCIPEILKDKDVVGQAETGSGKTLAFSLPILDKIQKVCYNGLRLDECPVGFQGQPAPKGVSDGCNQEP